LAARRAHAQSLGQRDPAELTTAARKRIARAEDDSRALSRGTALYWHTFDARRTATFDEYAAILHRGVFSAAEGNMAKRSRTAMSMNYFEGRYFNELIGTLMLVLIGCGSIVLSGFAVPAAALQIGMAFGLTVAAVAYSFGLASSGHINPAVTIAVWSAGRMSTTDAIMYIVYQLIGALLGAGILMLIMTGKAGTPATVANLGQNVILGGYSIAAAIAVEFIATLIFTLVILGATGGRAGPAMAGLIIGLTLVALHLAFISINGLSVNPARSFGPAVFVRGAALEQLWIFLLAPSAAGWLAGWVYKSKWLD
jgi:aquaporin Z